MERWLVRLGVLLLLAAAALVALVITRGG